MSQVSLLDMPEKPMKRIMAACEFRSILSLYKTCHQLRTFIKINKPGPQIVQIGFTRRIVSKSHCSSIYLSISFDEWHDRDKYSSCSGCFKLFYTKQPNGCEIVWNPSESYSFTYDIHQRKMLRDQDYKDIFMRDLQVILDLQKSSVKKFHFCGGTMLSEIFHEAMKTRSSTSKFQVQEIEFSLYTQQQILDVLSYFCPKTLDSLRIYCFEDIKEKYMTLTEVSKTEQWKCANRIELLYGQFVVPIENFVHFNRGSVIFETCTVENLRVLKEAFLASKSASKHFCLTFIRWREQDAIKQFLDSNLEMDIAQNRFLYRRPHNPCQILRIEFEENRGDKNHNVTFDVLKIDEITEDEKARLPKIEIHPKMILKGLIEELTKNSENSEDMKEEQPVMTHFSGIGDHFSCCCCYL
ncbi:unnamed protein product [Caenorhabditis brenneri]